MLRRLALISLVVTQLCAVGASAAETVLRRASGGEPDTLDPQRSTLAIEGAIINEFLHGLVKRNGRGEIVPASAVDWSTSEDGLTWMFTLRRGLVWSDGTPIVAMDFVAGTRRLFDPETAAINASLLYVIKNSRVAASGDGDVTDIGVEAPREDTVVFRLENPDPNFLSSLAYRYITPLPRHIYPVASEAWSPSGDVPSNGPFRLVSWRAHEEIRLERNPSYYDADKVKFDGVVYYPAADITTGIKQFRAGELDYLNGYPTPDYETLKKQLGDQVRRAPVHSVSYLIPNFEVEVYRDARVRKAISLAIDRHALADKVLRGSAAPAWHYVPPTVPAYVELDLPSAKLGLPDRQAEARRLLEEAGFGRGNPLQITLNAMSNPTGKRVAVALRAMWQQVGIKTEISTLEMRVHYSNMDHQKFDLGFSAWVSFDDPLQYLSALVSVEGDMITYNSGHYSNPAFDRLISEAVQIADLDSRNARFSNAEKILLEEDGVIPLYYGSSGNLVRTGLMGYEDNPWDAHASEFMWFE